MEGVLTAVYRSRFKLLDLYNGRDFMGTVFDVCFPYGCFYPDMYLTQWIFESRDMEKLQFTFWGQLRITYAFDPC